VGVLAWIVAPWLRDQLGGDDPFAQALLICITVGQVWQFVLVLILIRRELGGLECLAARLRCRFGKAGAPVVRGWRSRGWTTARRCRRG
jgi:hypothetical protein